MPASRVKFALSVSGLVHVGSFVGLSFWVQDASPSRFEYVVARGEAALDQTALPSAAERPIQMVVEASETIAPRDEPPPIDIESERIHHHEPPLPAVADLAVVKQVVEHTAAERANTEIEVDHPDAPVPSSPPRQSPSDNDPVVTDFTPQPLARHTPDAPELETQHSVVVLPQLAMVAGAEADHYPRWLTNPAPPYPADALLAGIQGRVMIRVLVRADGLVGAASIDASSGSPSLDAAALIAVRRWRFEPARRGGVPVEFEFRFPVDFGIRRS